MFVYHTRGTAVPTFNGNFRSIMYPRLQAYFDSVDDDDVEPGIAPSGKSIVQQLFSHVGGGAFR